VQYGYTDAVKISAWLVELELELELQRLWMSGLRVAMKLKSEENDAFDTFSHK
jgi:hypothetical protein